ncbi:MAG: hypothetical protein OXG35_27615 [Acidobacteria bacterium]|nr:hypothetical protein [Acidobacteriota bacterium]
MSDAQVPPPPASATTPDTKALIRTIVGTGIGLGTLLLMLIGLMLQQNAAVNTRIDDLNVSVNARFGDVNARIDDVTANVNARIDDVNANMNARFDDLRSDINRRFDDVQADIREIRAMLSELLKGDPPAADLPPAVGDPAAWVAPPPESAPRARAGSRPFRRAKRRTPPASAPAPTPRLGQRREVGKARGTPSAPLAPHQVGWGHELKCTTYLWGAAFHGQAGARAAGRAAARHPPS